MKISHNSFVKLTHCTLLHISTGEYDLIEASSSSIVIQNTSISDFNATFIRAIGVNLTLEDSQVNNGGLITYDKYQRTWVTAGFLDCSDCRNILIRGSELYGMRGNSGGSISAVATDMGLSAISIQSSQFISCQAVDSGGALRLVYVQLTVENTFFNGNSAMYGGAVFFDCNENFTCSAVFSNTSFIFNSALQGGALQWTYTRPTWISFLDANNTAVYGDLEAARPHHLAVLNADKISNAVFGVGGVMGTTPIVIGMLDSLDQVIATDNFTRIQIATKEAILQGGTVVSATMGVANFSSILINAPPGSIITLVAYTSEHILPETTFTYVLRDCIPGELISSSGCTPCSKNTYSLTPNSSSCNFCPEGATCPGGAKLVLDRGYWRPDNMTDTIFLCEQADACKGGSDSECGSGYEGRLCSICEDGYYNSGVGYCSACLPKVMHWITALLVSVGYIGFVVIFINLSLSNTRVIVLRIAIHFFHILLSFSLIYIDWSYAVSILFQIFDSFSSTMVTNFTVKCIVGALYLDFSISTVYVRSIAASALPIIFLPFSLFLKLLSQLLRLKSTSSIQTFLFLLYLSYPYAIMTGLEIVTCASMEDGVSWLQADLSIRCWDTSHRKFVLTLFLPVVLLYVLGTPLLLAICCYSQARLSIQCQMVEFMKAGYMSEFVFWDLFYVFFKIVLLVSVCLMGSIDSKVQLLLVFLLLYVLLSYLYLRSPYESEVCNTLAKGSIALLLSIAVSGYFLSPAVKIRVELHVLLYTLVIAAVALQVLASVALFVCSKKREVLECSVHPEILSDSSYSIQFPNPNPSLQS